MTLQEAMERKDAFIADRRVVALASGSKQMCVSCSGISEKSNDVRRLHESR